MSAQPAATPTPTLTAIRAIHSGVFLVMLAAIGWLVMTGLVGRRDRSVALAGGLVAVEACVFVANRGVCPLTPLAERLGATRGGVSDIFLPDAVARTIPIWSTALIAVAIVLHARAALGGRRAARDTDDPGRRDAMPANRRRGARRARAAATARRCFGAPGAGWGPGAGGRGLAC